MAGTPDRNEQYRSGSACWKGQVTVLTLNQKQTEERKAECSKVKKHDPNSKDEPNTDVPEDQLPEGWKKTEEDKNAETINSMAVLNRHSHIRPEVAAEPGKSKLKRSYHETQDHTEAAPPGSAQNKVLADRDHMSDAIVGPTKRVRKNEEVKCRVTFRYRNDVPDNIPDPHNEDEDSDEYDEYTEEMWLRGHVNKHRAARRTRSKDVAKFVDSVHPEDESLRPGASRDLEVKPSEVETIGWEGYQTDCIIDKLLGLRDKGLEIFTARVKRDKDGLPDLELHGPTQETLKVRKYLNDAAANGTRVEMEYDLKVRDECWNPLWKFGCKQISTWWRDR